MMKNLDANSLGNRDARIRKRHDEESERERERGLDLPLVAGSRLVEIEVGHFRKGHTSRM